jgi:diguanylate cyclase (GGDEF)-like protein
MIGVLILRPRREWIWILLGYCAASARDVVVAGQPWPSIGVDCLCNLFEIVFAAASLPAFHGLSQWLRKPRLIFKFTIFGLIGAPLLAGSTWSVYAAMHYGEGFWGVMLKWVPGDMLGIALFSPLVLVLFSGETYELFRSSKLGQSLPMFGILMVVSWLVFHQSAYPAAFLAFAVLVVVVNRMGFPGAVLAVNLLTLVAASGTIKGMGPFMFVQGHDEAHRFMALQIYLTVAMVMCFSITLTGLERDDFQEQLKLALEKMEVLAVSDGLTGIANRRHFDATLEREWNRAQRDRHSIGVILLDADNFKAYNDTYGHLAGDVCLCAIANTLASQFKRAGDLAARYGGEEFIVLLVGATLDQASALAESVREGVEALRMEHTGTAAQHVTVSVGCSAIVPYEELSSAKLVASADEALYAAKQSGRNRVVCATSGMESVLLRER